MPGDSPQLQCIAFSAIRQNSPLLAPSHVFITQSHEAELLLKFSRLAGTGDG